MSNWEGIDEFVAVAETGHFTGAATRLGVSSSHVSRQIARLEDRLQSRLFYRSTRRVSLTEAGQTFLQHCQRLIDARDEALQAITDLGSDFYLDGYFMFIAPGGLDPVAREALGNAIRAVAEDSATEANALLTKGFGGPSVRTGEDLDTYMADANAAAAALIKAVSE